MVNNECRSIRNLRKPHYRSVANDPVTLVTNLVIRHAWGKDRIINKESLLHAKWKRTNNDLSNTTQKTKDRATRTPLKTGGELMCFGKVSSSWSTTDTRRVTLVTNLVIRHAWGKDRIINKESLLHAEMTKRTYRHKHHSL